MQGGSQGFDGNARLERRLAYGITLLIIAAALLLARKVWETNDDIGMSMVSQGYGIAGARSAGVVFSNVIWGWLLAHTPTLVRVDGYSLLNYLALLLAAAAILASLVRAGTSHAMACAVLLMLLVPTLLTPQFTLLAGYLAVAGFAVLLAWREQPSLASLVCAGCLLFTAALVRQLEMLFVAAVAAPFFLPSLSRPMLRKRWLVLAAVLLAAMGAAKLADHAYYTDSSWSEFRAMNADRVSFTDYRLGYYYGHHPDAVRAAGLEPNDIGLLSHWFYSDPQVFVPAKLDVLRERVAPMERIRLNLSHLRADLRMLMSPQFLLLCGLLIALAAMLRRRLLILAGSLAVVLCASLVLGLMGRMGLNRVYMPVVAALSVMYMCCCAERTPGLRAFGVALLAAATGLSVFWILPRLGNNPVDRRLEAALCSLPGDQPKVAWGARNWPYLLVYRPGQQPERACQPRFYALGSMQLAPYSLDTLRELTGHADVVSGLLAGKGIYLFTGADRLPELKRYFADHYHKALAARQIVDIPHLHGYAVQVSGDAKPADDEQVLPDQDDDDNPPD